MPAAFVPSAPCISIRARGTARLSVARAPWLGRAPAKRPRAAVPAAGASRTVLRAQSDPVAAEDVSKWPLGSPTGGMRVSPSRWFEGLRGDLARRGPLYRSDWTDGFSFKSVPVVLFLYFACLAPVVAFGGLTSALTGGSMGCVEFLLSSGATGMLYAVMSGQPLTFLAPTGLTLAFTTALYGFCEVAGVAFLPTYSWVGIWTSLILFFASVANASDLIKYCTRFTDDIFNSLIATNFIYEATRNLLGAFFVVGADKTTPFTALALAFGTVILGRFFTGLRSSRYFVRRVRTLLADFGPVLAIAVMSAVAAIPAVARVGLKRLSIPETFSLAGGRALLVPILQTPMSLRLLCMVPAVLLTCLFFLDQNISSRVVNGQPKVRKGPGYHLDMMMLAICTFVCSICGLPLMCAGTVQSLAHVQALSNVESNGNKERVVSVQENRLTAFLVHGLILCSLLLLPIVKRIPMAVISGLFLFLGRNMMNGNDFLARIPLLAMDPKLYPEDSPMKRAPARQVHSFTLLQIACLTMLWALKLNKRTSMFFPAVIGTLMFIRSRIVPRFFSGSTLAVLDSDVVEAAEDKARDALPSGENVLRPASN